MQIVLADLKGGEGFISKDTVAGGYGSRLRPFSRVTAVIARMNLRIAAPAVRKVVAALDSGVARLHARREVGLMERPLSC